MDVFLAFVCGGLCTTTIWFRRPVGMLFYSGFREVALIVFLMILSATFGCAAGVEWAGLR